VMVYHVSSERDPSRDAGIRWDSFDAAWPVENPIVSPRDSSFVSLTGAQLHGATKLFVECISRFA
jgi:dTDP-4-dehydrorhamnose 3,5-epimerase-like enzyme